MKFSKKVTMLLSILMITMTTSLCAKQATDEFSNVEIITSEVTKGIYMLTGKGGNIAVSVGDDGVFMIDDQFAPLTPKIKLAIAELSNKPLRFVINTHWHFDHTGGNENIGKEKVVIVAHDNVRERMSKDNFIAAFKKEVPASPKVALPMITFKDTVTFHLNNQEIQVVHYKNAHTDGDSIVFFKTANVIHMGDNFFNGLYPFIDASSGGNVMGMIAAVEAVLKIADDETKIIPGHGPLGNKESLTAFRDMLLTTSGRMQRLLDDGKTLDEIIALKSNVDLDKTWGNGFLNSETYIKILHSVMP